MSEHWKERTQRPSSARSASERSICCVLLRAMQFCGGGGLSRPCPNVSGGTMRNGSVEATSPTSGKSPWCRLLPCLLRSPRSAPSPRTTLLHEPSAAVLGSGGCDLLPKDHHLHRCP